MARAFLIGGACDQQTRTLTSTQENRGTLTCQGDSYSRVARQHDPEYWLRVGDDWVTLHGAPCDGKQLGLAPTQFKKGEITCQGHLYVNALGAKGVGAFGQVVWWEAKLLEGSDQPSTAPAHVSKAWSRWMRALGHQGPDAHNRLRKATARVNRIAR